MCAIGLASRGARPRGVADATRVHIHIYIDSAIHVYMHSVKEAAALLGCSPGRVRQLLASGRMSGRRVSNVWLVESASVQEFKLNRPGPHPRPLSARVANAVMQMLDVEYGDYRPLGQGAAELSPSEQSRVRGYVRRLRDADKPAQLLRAWMRGRDNSVGYHFAGSLQILRADQRLVPAGVSDPRSGIASPALFEARCADNDHLALVDDYYLIEAPDPNVLLHIGGDVEPSPVSELLLELAQHNSPRGDMRVREILSGGMHG